MGLKGRVRKLEEGVYGGPYPPCLQCGNTIKMITVCEGGWYLFEGCEPCSICDAQPGEALEEAGDRNSPELIRYSRGHPHAPITRIHVTCPEEPFEVPKVGD